MSPASMLSSKGFATVVDLNLNGTFNMCKAAFEGYMGEHGGRIVNIVAECRNGFPRMVHTVRLCRMLLLHSDLSDHCQRTDVPCLVRDNFRVLLGRESST